MFNGFSTNACLSLTFLVYLFSGCVRVSALDTITPSLPIQEPNTISSNNSMFTLGFFTPQNSTACYVGIWCMSKSTIVWVANRDNPLTNSFGILAISENGNFVVLNRQKQVLWSTNVSNIAANSSAQLLDSGNLVLVDGMTGERVWQSFLHPSSTMLQGTTLRTNKETGQSVRLTSWKSPSDPSFGVFSCGLEVRSVVEAFVWKENRPYWRSGPWDGTDFLGIPGKISSIFQSGFQIKEEDGNFNISFYIEGESTVTFTLDPQGKMQQRTWDPETKRWDHTWMSLNSECDVYGKCGPFGICNSRNSPICSCLKGFEPKNKQEWGRQNWTSGCVRREPLQCERDSNGSQASKTDGFLKLERVKVPDNAKFLFFDVNNVKDCRTPCLLNCSCKAYAHGTSFGCLVWNVDLLDIQSFSDRGIDLYLRLASSELVTNRRKTRTYVLISILVGTVLTTALGYFLWKKGSKRKDDLELKQIQDLPLFDFRKVVTATDNFDVANKLGQGGFGPVYKGKLEDGQEIAVKRLSRSSRQGMEEFVNEVELISKLQHRNLVRLLGCCVEREEQILIYEYMSNKSLDAYIFDPLKQKDLNWGKRFIIIEGIARGLLYLHRDSRLKIVHRDLKASNILLDEGMNPKISDFGMAKPFGCSENQANTQRIVGTYGYISPEYAAKGLYSEKSDVFSFGVLLLEIVSGRKNTSFYEDAESLTLLGFAWRLWNDANVMPLIDPQIYDPSFHKDILRCIQIGLLCVQELAKYRPAMASIMSMLHNEIMDIPTPSQPAFILRQTMSHATEQSSNNLELCSINKVTISSFVGR